MSESWGEGKTLLDTIDAVPQEQRPEVLLRLRAVLRRVIGSIIVLVVPRGRDRLAAVQIFFADGDRRREYLILHRPDKANASGRTRGGWWCRSLADKSVVGPLDLRQAAHVEALESELQALDLAALTEGSSGGNGGNRAGK